MASLKLERTNLNFRENYRWCGSQLRQLVLDLRLQNLRCFASGSICFMTTSLASSKSEDCVWSSFRSIVLDWSHLPEMGAVRPISWVAETLSSLGSMIEENAAMESEGIDTDTCWPIPGVNSDTELLPAAPSWMRGGDPVGVLKICAKTISCRKLSNLRNDRALCSVSRGRIGGTSPNPKRGAHKPYKPIIHFSSSVQYNIRKLRRRNGIKYENGFKLQD